MLFLKRLYETLGTSKKNSQKNYKELLEDAPANATGAAVAGTGDSGVSWVSRPYRVGLKGERKHKGRYINGVAYLKKMARESAKKKQDT